MIKVKKNLIWFRQKYQWKQVKFDSFKQISFLLSSNDLTTSLSLRVKSSKARTVLVAANSDTSSGSWNNIPVSPDTLNFCLNLSHNWVSLDFHNFCHFLVIVKPDGEMGRVHSEVVKLVAALLATINGSGS